MRGLQTFGAPLRRYLGSTPGQGQPPILKMKRPLAPRRKGPEVVHDPCDPPPESVPRFYPLALLLCIRGSSSCLRSYSTCDGTVCRHLCVSLLPSEPPGKPPGAHLEVSVFSLFGHLLLILDKPTSWEWGTRLPPNETIRRCYWRGPIRPSYTYIYTNPPEILAMC